MSKHEDELVELHKFVDELGEEMKHRLVKKYYDNFRGWDNPDFRDQFKARAMNAILEGKFIDAMNFCGMVHMIDKNQKEQDGDV